MAADKRHSTDLLRALVVELIDGRGNSVAEAAVILKRPPQFVGSLYCTAKRYRAPEQLTLGFDYLSH